MNNCKRCGNTVKRLVFSADQRLELWGLLVQNLDLFAIKKIVDEFLLSQEEAKIVLAHFNTGLGQCHRCNFENLQVENTECPKCHAFNYNVAVSPLFNQTFCAHLEWSLSFEELEDDRIRGFWCDGVDHLPIDIRNLSKTQIRKNRTIKTKAWIGKDGQSIYEMTIKLGEQSLENYERDQNLLDCIPKENCKEWIKISPTDRHIEIQLK